MMYREQKDENTKKAQETYITCSVHVMYIHTYVRTYVTYVYMLFYITCDRCPRREGIGQEWYFLKMIKNMDSRSLHVPTRIKCSKTAENKIKGKNCENSQKKSLISKEQQEYSIAHFLEETMDVRTQWNSY